MEVSLNVITKYPILNKLRMCGIDREINPY